ncbi:MAG TPA: cytochrome c-type biogenesis protein CcmH [Terriglobales bacterium]|nr:cytochrome c-type biogenesis protein CcmH [Terriglobales bacterium]
MTHRIPWREAALAGALAAAAAALAFAIASGSGDPGTPEQRAHAIAATLKCPVCHDLSAADSPAPVAQQMRAQILSEVKAGRTPDQIRAEFVASYGDWILLDPPPRGLELLPWVAPAVLALCGLGITAYGIRRWSARARTDAPGPEHAPVDDADRRLLERAIAGLRSEIE